ncbi:uncharacterized protein LOC119101261 [Pollicipes pollicipes]|uniref:uncharacterized protein LOC119101261 n=1 Tax=Pollicipes pollicipes TaxID=41117 RepID=UPI001884F3F6|nr:uncharacterized protein LOC119101261 [Pollicipes pollicipes]
MRERRRTTASSASYTGFKAVEGFQYPSVWKKAGQSVGTLLLVGAAAVLACGVHSLLRHGADCSAACSPQTATDVATVTLAAADLALQLLLLLSLQRGWPAGTVAASVWCALKAAAAVYLLLHSTYQLHTEPGSVLIEHLAAQAALALALAVALYTVASAAHEQRAANRIDGDGLP